ncbi:MAG: GNAT family N-acetyltransferase [Candidatus Hodarchaeota archaeon]
MNLRYEIVSEKDIPEITTLMIRTFDDDTQKHLGKPKGGPPEYDTEEFFQRCVESEETPTGYKIMLDDKIIGAFIVFIYKNGKNYLGRIFIDPDYHNRGIGTRAWKFIEETYPDTQSWVLDTPEWAKRNHYFYEQKCGFKKVREEHIDGDPPGKLFIYQKDMN